MQLEDQKMPRHSHLSYEDQAWLDSFPDDRKKAVVRKVGHFPELDMFAY